MVLLERYRFRPLSLRTSAAASASHLLDGMRDNALGDPSRSEGTVCVRNQTSEGETITGSVKCEQNAVAACPIRVFGQGVDVDRDEETVNVTFGKAWVPHFCFQSFQRQQAIEAGLGVV